MIKKKNIYLIIAFVVIIVGYFNYFGEDKEIKDIKKVVETTDVVYESDGYHLEAKKQLDYIDEKESKFEKAKAKIKGMILSGDNVFLDKAKNLLLKSNIIGISPNGWKINASELKYNKETDELISNEKVSAINEKENFEISGNHFKTNISMDYIVLENDVAIKNKYVVINADKASYNSKDKKVILEGNIRISGIDDENTKKLNGDFKSLYYDIDQRNLYANDGFRIKYDGIELVGDKLVFNDQEEKFTALGNIKVYYDTYIFSADKIEKKSNSDVIDIIGLIKGGNEIYQFVADKGMYQIKEKNFYVNGNIKINSKDGEKLEASSLVYNIDNNNLDIVGNKILYTSNDYNLEGEHFIYNIKTKDFATDKSFFASSKDGKKIRGKDFKYNLESKDFSALSEVKIENNEYILMSRNVSYVNSNSILNLPEEYILKSKDEKNQVTGKEAIYNLATEELKTSNPIILTTDDLEITGKNLIYNNKTKLGKIDGPIDIFSDKNKIKGSAKEIIIKKDEYINLVGPINIRQGTMDIATDNLVYSYKDSLIHNNEINFKDDVKKLIGSISEGAFNINDKIYRGKNFNAISDEKNISSKELVYYLDKKKVELAGDVYVKSLEDTIKSKRLLYNLVSKDIQLDGNNTISYQNYIVKSLSMILNKENGYINAKNIEFNDLSTDNKFYADKTLGNIYEGLIHFSENVKGSANEKSGKIDFKGEMVDLYLEKSGEAFKVNKIEVKDKAKITQDNKEIDASYILIDLTKNIAISKENPVLLIRNIDKLPTEITAKNVEIDLTEKIAKLKDSVHVKDYDKNNQEINLYSDSATVSQKEVNVYGNLKIVNSESILTSDEGKYDMEAKKIKLKGNVHLNYRDKKENTK